MGVYFRSEFPKNGNKEKVILRVKRMDAILDNIMGLKHDNDDNIYNIEKDILMHDKPNIWNIHQPDNMEKVLEVDFQKYAISVIEQTGQKLTDVTIMEFYASVSHLKDKFSDGKHNNQVQ